MALWVSSRSSGGPRTRTDGVDSTTVRHERHTFSEELNMANILDLQALEAPQEDMALAGSTQSNHCDDTSSLSMWC
ncbi:hypothetical protein GCM10010357_62360 [Streptomyces luteireticuli]|uniref:SapB/AmfS family lantipeptide n=1 Tax=Streptomyces luteireticuli TaxID=173858 RepID=A0ABN0Z406_9ACTN